MTAVADRPVAGARQGSRAGAVLALAAVAALASGTLAGTVAAGWGWPDFVGTYTLTNLVNGAGLAVAGGLIAWHRPRNAVGLVLVVAGLGHLVSAVTAPVGTIALAAGWPPGLSRLLATVFLSGWPIGLPGLFLLALLLFPTGHLPSPRWRWLAIAIVAFAVWGMVTSALEPTAIVRGNPASVSLLAVPWLPDAVIEIVTAVVSTLLLPPVVASLIVRYRRGDERIKRQLLWLILAVVVMLMLNAQRWITGNGPILLLLSFVAVPIAIAIAVIRHQLLDIRIVLSRTLLYLVLIAIVVALYAAIVAGLVLLLPPTWDRGAAIAAALAVAFAFAPLRHLLQRTINRGFYGSRDDPVRTAERVGRGLGDAGNLHDVLAVARSALRVPRLGVVLVPDGQELAFVGDDPVDAVRTTVTLSTGGEAIGALVITLRVGDRRLHEADRRSIALVASPIALLLRERALVHAVRDARARTVEEVERQRAQLRRDLHDGLGPTLTGAALRADAAANLIASDPARARELLGQTRTAIREAFTEVRRVVYGLRPIPLDEFGLIGALNEFSTRQSQLVVTICAVDPLPPLTPAVELAAYRIAIEAITNAQRHSDGSTVRILIDAARGTLRVLITDDGTPRGTYRGGAGIESMTHRAEELGGTVAVGPRDNG